MAQGIWVNGERPRTKKALREALAEAPDTVKAEATSIFGGEHEGPVTELPKGKTITFAGPCPHTKRNFFGTIRWDNGKLVCQ